MLPKSVLLEDPSTDVHWRQEDVFYNVEQVLYNYLTQGQEDILATPRLILLYIDKKYSKEETAPTQNFSHLQEDTSVTKYAKLFVDCFACCLDSSSMQSAAQHCQNLTTTCKNALQRCSIVLDKEEEKRLRKSPSLVLSCIATIPVLLQIMIWTGQSLASWYCLALLMMAG